MNDKKVWVTIFWVWVWEWIWVISELHYVLLATFDSSWWVQCYYNFNAKKKKNTNYVWKVFFDTGRSTSELFLELSTVQHSLHQWVWSVVITWQSMYWLAPQKLPVITCSMLRSCDDNDVISMTTEPSISWWQLCEAENIGRSLALLNVF